MAESIEVQGVDELVSKFTAMGRKASTKFAIESLRPAANLIKREAQSIVRVKTGALRSTIRISSSTKGDTVKSVIGPKHLFKGKAFYAGFIELGHFMGNRLRGKKYGGQGGKELYHKDSLKLGRKWVPAFPFMAPAFAAKKAEAEASIKSNMEKAIQDDWKAK